MTRTDLPKGGWGHGPGRADLGGEAAYESVRCLASGVPSRGTMHPGHPSYPCAPRGGTSEPQVLYRWTPFSRRRGRGRCPPYTCACRRRCHDWGQWDSPGHVIKRPLGNYYRQARQVVAQPCHAGDADA
jgi:hypothetical protein